TQSEISFFAVLWPRIHGRAAGRAECKHPPVAAICNLYICSWLSLQKPKAAGDIDRGSKGRSGQCLTVGTVANVGRGGVDLGLVFERAAKALTINMHCSLLACRFQSAGRQED